MLDAARAGESVLLIAPTGGGKTLAGFLPTPDRAGRQRRATGLHTLYVSPLKALATDIARNLTAPGRGDGPADPHRDPHRRHARQPSASASASSRRNILLTTPESLALLLSLPDAPAMFAGLQAVVIDEVHALAGTKRGDQLALCLARLAHAGAGRAPRRPVGHRRAPATRCAAYRRRRRTAGRLIEAPDGAPPELSMMLPRGARCPGPAIWAWPARREILERIRARRHDHRVRQHPRPGAS